MGCCASSPETLEEGGADGAKVLGSACRSARKHESSVSSSSSGVDFGSLNRIYTPVRLLGSGGCGDTYLMTENSTGKRVAVKVISRPLPKVMVDRIETEIIVQAVLSAQCSAVVEAYDAVLTDKHLALAMELAEGGSMTDYVTSKFKASRGSERRRLFLSEAEACYYFRQFIDAVGFCHKNHIAHRDLKLDNTLLTGDSPMHLKLADFGFAKSWTADSHMSTILGTPEYMSPEQAMAGNHSVENYDASHSDIWSSGVVLFVMLLGFFPFEVSVPDYQTPAHDFQRQLREVWAQQQDEKWYRTKHVAEGWALLSEPCRDLLVRIFEYDEEKRISLEEIKAHPWYTQKLPLIYTKELRRLEAAARAREERHGATQDPIGMRQRASRLRAIVQAAAHPAGSDEAAAVLSSQPPPEDETQTWAREAGKHLLLTKVSLKARSWMSAGENQVSSASSASSSQSEAKASLGKDHLVSMEASETHKGEIEVRLETRQ